jgi:hypothetical protein
MGMAGPGRHRASREDVELGRVFLKPRWIDKPHPWLTRGGQALMVALILGMSGAVIKHFIWVQPDGGIPAHRDGNQGPANPRPIETGGVVDPGPGGVPTVGPSLLPTLGPPTCTDSGGTGGSAHTTVHIAHIALGLGVVVGDGQQARQTGQTMAQGTSGVRAQRASDEQPVCAMPSAHPLRRAPSLTPSTKRTPRATTRDTPGLGRKPGRTSVVTSHSRVLQCPAGQPLATTPSGHGGAIVPGLVTATPGGGGGP